MSRTGKMPATNSRRCSSASSASTSGNSTKRGSRLSSGGVKKKFACTWDGCGKSFSRSEHLHRHALNHKDGDHTCLRCRAHFRRRDLLDRHMARHKEKDDEAGGEGLGILATRKRLWRDPEGNIVNSRRPYPPNPLTKKRQTVTGNSTTTSTKQAHRRITSFSEDSVEIKQEPASIVFPLSTTSSNGSSIYSQGSSQLHDDGLIDGPNPMLHESWNLDPALLSTAPPTGSVEEDFEFLCNTSWVSQTTFETFMGGHSSGFVDDEVFKSETGIAGVSGENFYSSMYSLGIAV